ncbi:MAG TPA: TonB-dependent receptor [Terracidiphilus sp.]
MDRKAQKHPHRIQRAIRLVMVLPGIFCLLAITSLGAHLSAQAVPSKESSPHDLNNLSMEQLGNIEVISVSKEPEQVWHTPAAVFVISKEDIRRSGATSIPEALRLAPGVEVGRIDANHWSVSIRGFGGQFSRNLLVLIDGRSVYSLLYSGVYWDAQNVMLEDVDRIEVIRGPGGTIWGANAVNGVINVITRSAKDTQGILSALGSGNVDQGEGAARYGGRAKNNFNYRLYSMGLIRGAEFHSDGGNFDHWRLGQIGFRADWQRGDQDSFTVQGDAYREESEESLPIASFSPFAELIEEGKAYVSGGNLILRWQHKADEHSDIRVQAYFDRTNRRDFEYGETRDTFDFDFVQHAEILRGHEITWGLGARVSPSAFIQTSAGVNFLPNKQTDSIYSGFLQYRLPLVPDRLWLTAGTKLEHNNFSGFEYQPSVRLLWSPTQHQSLWTAITRAVRTPSRVDEDAQIFIVEQTSPQPPIVAEIVGDPKLKAERLIAYEGGYRAQLKESVYLDVAAFYNSYNDLQGYGPIAASVSDDPPPLHILAVLPYANVIKGDTSGMEISPNWNITEWWQLRTSYSYLHMDLRDKPGFNNVPNLYSSYVGSSPSHLVSFQSIFSLPKHIALNQTYRYVSQIPTFSVHPYSTADAGLDWEMGRGLNLSVIGQNLLRPTHAEFGGDPGPLVEIKRSVFARLTWTR